MWKSILAILSAAIGWARDKWQDVRAVKAHEYDEQAELLDDIRQANEKNRDSDTWADAVNRLRREQDDSR